MPATAPIAIAASILSADFADFGREIEAVEAAGADRVHVDVMDGHFVPNLTFGPALCRAIRPRLRTVLDVHLMVSPVDPYIDAIAGAGADLITAHAEAGPHLHRSLQRIRATGARTGLALNPATPVEAAAHVLDLVDTILVMGVNPGFGGQTLIPSQLDKIARLRAMAAGRPIEIAVDGGVSAETAPRLATAGATVLVAGAAVFEGGSPDDPEAYGRHIRSLRTAAETARGDEA